MDRILRRHSTSSGPLTCEGSISQCTAGAGRDLPETPAEAPRAKRRKAAHRRTWIFIVAVVGVGDRGLQPSALFSYRHITRRASGFWCEGRTRPKTQARVRRSGADAPTATRAWRRDELGAAVQHRFGPIPGCIAGCTAL